MYAMPVAKRVQATVATDDLDFDLAPSDALH